MVVYCHVPSLDHAPLDSVLIFWKALLIPLRYCWGWVTMTTLGRCVQPQATMAIYRSRSILPSCIPHAEADAGVNASAGDEERGSYVPGVEVRREEGQHREDAAVVQPHKEGATRCYAQPHILHGLPMPRVVFDTRRLPRRRLMHVDEHILLEEVAEGGEALLQEEEEVVGACSGHVGGRDAAAGASPAAGVVREGRHREEGPLVVIRVGAFLYSMEPGMKQYRI